jgi:hypothetical protein
MALGIGFFLNKKSLKEINQSLFTVVNGVVGRFFFKKNSLNLT